jgi:hypothetical protein
VAHAASVHGVIDVPSASTPVSTLRPREVDSEPKPKATVEASESNVAASARAVVKVKSEPLFAPSLAEAQV